MAPSDAQGNPPPPSTRSSPSPPSYTPLPSPYSPPPSLLFKGLISVSSKYTNSTGFPSVGGLYMNAMKIPGMLYCCPLFCFYPRFFVSPSPTKRTTNPPTQKRHKTTYKYLTHIHTHRIRTYNKAPSLTPPPLARQKNATTALQTPHQYRLRTYKKSSSTVPETLSLFPSRSAPPGVKRKSMHHHRRT